METAIVLGNKGTLQEKSKQKEVDGSLSSKPDSCSDKRKPRLKKIRCPEKAQENPENVVFFLLIFNILIRRIFQFLVPKHNLRFFFIY